MAKRANVTAVFPILVSPAKMCSPLKKCDFYRKPAQLRSVRFVQAANGQSSDNLAADRIVAAEEETGRRRSIGGEA